MLVFFFFLMKMWCLDLDGWNIQKKKKKVESLYLLYFVALKLEVCFIQSKVEKCVILFQVILACEMVRLLGNSCIA